MPSVIRVVVGLVVAGGLPGLLIALLALPGGTVSNALGFGAFLAIFYGVAPALILGLPAVYVLRSLIKPTLKSAIAAGAIVASIPVVFAALTTNPIILFVIIASVPLGAIGGAAFWFVALRNLRPVSVDATSPSSESP